jgi:hypothetical protein
MEFWENKLATEVNSGGFQLSIVASYSVGSIKYIIRIEKPNWEKVEYVISQDGLKKLGELLLDLHSFSEEKLKANENSKVRELLTAKNLEEYSRYKKAVKISH